jgi:hypothetical protein
MREVSNDYMRFSGILCCHVRQTPLVGKTIDYILPFLDVPYPLD